MKDQHEKIKGYRDLTEEEIAMMNAIKAKEAELANLFKELDSMPSIDKRWLSIARTDLQKGFMSAVRSIARPVTEFDY